jgi:glutamyl-tRNA synthetase
LLPWVESYLKQQNIEISHGPDLLAVMDLFKSRIETLVDWAQQVQIFYAPFHLPTHLNELVNPKLQTILTTLANQFDSLEWSVSAISSLIKETLQTHQLKMPELAIPLRWCILGQGNSPSLDQVLYLLGKEACMNRLQQSLDSLSTTRPH